MAESRDAKDIKKIFEEEFSLFMDDVTLGAKEEILKNFDNEKDVDGSDFAELRPSTVKDRRQQNYGGEHPILKRSRNLRNSIEVIPNMASKTWAVSSLDYGEHLHDGRRNMSPRRILDFPENFKEGGVKRASVFEEFLQRFEERFLDIYG